jgi:hypothetical protein
MIVSGDSMMPVIQSKDKAIQRFQPDHEFWIDALLNNTGSRPVIEVHYKNPELAGVWMLRYPLGRLCFKLLRESGRLVADPASGEHMYRYV